jgi:hypothetical protein
MPFDLFDRSPLVQPRQLGPGDRVIVAYWRPRLALVIEKVGVTETRFNPAHSGGTLWLMIWLAFS